MVVETNIPQHHPAHSLRMNDLRITLAALPVTSASDTGANTARTSSGKKNGLGKHGSRAACY
jgi:hypothetical protein